MLDLVFLRERMQKREIRLLSFLVFLKSVFWRCIFGKEADDLERDGLDEHTCKPSLYVLISVVLLFADYMIEREPVVNKFTRFNYDPSESERKNGSSGSSTLCFSVGVFIALLSCHNFLLEHLVCVAANARRHMHQRFIKVVSIHFFFSLQFH